MRFLIPALATIFASSACSSVSSIPDASGDSARLDSARFDSALQDSMAGDANLDASIDVGDAAARDGALDSLLDAHLDGSNIHCEDLPLESMESALTNSAHPCHEWLDRVAGRVVLYGFASGAIWTTRTPAQTALVVTAAHVASPCLPEGDCARALLDPTSQEFGGYAVQSINERGEGAFFRANFELFQQEIPAAENTARTTIRPRHDFSIYALDRQTATPSEVAFGRASGPIEVGEISLRDPQGLATQTPSFGSPTNGDLVLFAGRPRGGDLAGVPSFSVGKVLSNDEVLQAQTRLRAVGDEEGSVPYDSEAEQWVQCRFGCAGVGMSGGGAFDRDGRYVGTLVRASIAELDVQYVRFVRASFIATQLDAAIGAASETVRNNARPHLPR